MSNTEPGSDAANPDQDSPPPHDPRRRFLNGAVGAVAVAALAYFGWTRYTISANRPLDVSPGSTASKIALGPVSDYPPGAPPKLKLAKVAGSDKDATYIIENLGRNEFIVLSASCTHQGCVVDWSVEQDHLICPCHGGIFDKFGRNVSGPPKRPLPILHAVVENGHLFVHV